MAKPRGLGRGFDALIPTEVVAERPAAAAGGEAVQSLNVSSIRPNPHQPRSNFDEAELRELADSIRVHGIVHPIVVTKSNDGFYELIAGERRLRAAKLAGLQAVPAIVRSYGEQQKLELALIENLQRAELNPIEAAAAYRKLGVEFNLTLDQIGTRVGKAKSTVANRMRLLALPAAAQAAIVAGRLSEGHARQIVALDDATQQATLLRHILDDGWTVRQAEQFARRQREGVAGPAAKPSSVKAPASANNQLAQDLGSYLKVKVAIQPMAQGGRLVIRYGSDDELQRIIGAIKPEAS